jgi:hypothetical protein
MPVLGEEKSSTIVQQETVQFEEAGVPATGGLKSDFEPTYSEHTDEIATLGKFLERPVLIDQFTWSETDVFSFSPHYIDPWYLYFNNAYIKSKLANFSRLHCNMKLTFRFNASPFYYGVMRVAYDPLSSGKFDPLSTEDVVPLSQTPGVYLEPQVTSSAELTLPFLWPHTWLDTHRATSFHQMGKLQYNVFCQLQSANGATGTGITVSTYAEACDVEISGPTVATLLQSGVISGPASAVASFAKKFTGDSSVGAYAKAINVGASAVSSIAKIFGYSNAPITADVNPVQNKVFHSFANTETRVPIDKLALDPANEVTVDNRVAGDVGEDPLIIQKLAKIPSLVKILTWASSTGANTILQHGEVTPCIRRSSAGTSQVYVYYTPSGWASQMFSYWRGGMRYTFRVPRTAYHKGRLIVSWDPNGTLATLGVETAVFSKIFDLSSPDQEFSIDIPYKACSPWLRCLPGVCLTPTAPTAALGSANGYFVIGVLNPLTGPTASASVFIEVFAEALDDMEFAVPATLPEYETQTAIQSAEVAGGAVATDVALFDQTQVSYSDRIPEITVGERVGSLRTLLHRASHSITQHLGIYSEYISYGAGQYRTMNLYDRLPPIRGFQTTASYNFGTAVVGSGAKPCNYCKSHPINWVLHAFAGYRGSVVVHTNITGTYDIPHIWSIDIVRNPFSYWEARSAVTGTVRNVDFKIMTMQYGAQEITQDAVTENSQGYILSAEGQRGMTVTNGKTQMAMSAVVPQYCKTRFMPAAVNQRNEDFLDIVYDGWRLDATFDQPQAGMTSRAPYVDVYWAAGVDFNPVFFTGVPRLYSYVDSAIWSTNTGP